MTNSPWIPVEVQIKDSAFLRDPADNNGLLRLLMPGGNHVFKMRNVTFAGQGQAGNEAVIMAPQHCGLNYDGMATLCNVHYDFEDVDFTNVRGNGKWVGFGASGGSPTAPVYTSQDSSLNGHYFVISSLLNGFEKINGCYASPSDDHRFKDAIVCDREEVKIARLVIWTSSSWGLKKLVDFLV